MTEHESSVREQACLIADQLPAPWSKPLAACLVSIEDAKYARSVAYAWRRAFLLLERHDADPASLTGAEWETIRSRYMTRPGRKGEAVSLVSVRTFCINVRRVLREVHKELPEDVMAALPVTLPDEEGNIRNPGRPPSRVDSLIRAEAGDYRQARKILEELPEPWRVHLKTHLEDLEFRGKASSSGLAAARAWQKACRSFQEGTDPAKLDAKAWREMTMRWLRQPHHRDPSKTLERSTVASQAGYVRSVLKHAHPEDEYPKSIRTALGVPLGPMRLKGKVLDVAHFNALLEAARNEPEASAPHQVALKLALLWTVWDAGGRISEVLSLNQAGVKVTPTGGVLRMHKMPRQKSGPRDIAVTECAGPLLVWMEAHPSSHDLNTPLFCNLHSRTGKDRMSYQTASDLFARWRTRAGLPLVDGKAYRWHDLRHTRSTRNRRAKMDPAYQNANMGWSPGSTMGLLYGRADAEEILEVLRRDVGIDDLGFRDMVDAGDEVSALRLLLRKLMEGSIAHPTRRPAEHERR